MAGHRGTGVVVALGGTNERGGWRWTAQRRVAFVTVKSQLPPLQISAQGRRAPEKNTAKAAAQASIRQYKLTNVPEDQPGTTVDGYRENREAIEGTPSNSPTNTRAVRLGCSCRTNSFVYSWLWDHSTRWITRDEKAMIIEGQRSLSNELSSDLGRLAKTRSIVAVTLPKRKVQPCL